MTIVSKLPSSVMVRSAHPKELLCEYIEGLTAEKLGQILACPVPQARQILIFNAPLSTSMCLRLAHYFDTSFEYWHNMQYNYDISVLKSEEETIKGEIDSLKKNQNETN